ncbi:diguanylate cyclase domain-containing protein [Aliiglaciecola litoralis]|uniref:diguanylate cyclase n=1 Tax=Aliiglaciecola litoralis TaxID=582857 RepID=A0ABN1LPX0_9ALTE
MFKPEYSILIIDDDVTIIKLIAESLRSNFNVEFAVSAAEGLRQALKHPMPDLILLDVMMPSTNGFELCRTLKQNSATQQIPVIFVSALDDINEQQRGFALGAVDYVIKPISPLILKARVNTHIRVSSYVKQLQKLATTDPLTSCANRRKFDETLDLEWKRAARRGEPLSVLFFDIDEFKQYNDNYGHGMGDDCLKMIGNVLNNIPHRSADLVARYGGEEFVQILPDTDEEGAIKMAERTIKLIETLNIPHEFSKVCDFVTLSIGIATARPTSDKDICSVMQHADEALYRAKEEGKNRYNVYQ